MKKNIEYDIRKYIKSILEVNKMNLDAIIGTYKKCKKYNLNSDVSEYISYKNEELIYISPSFSDVKTNSRTSSLAPKFLLFSAPGATGKSTLGKHIAKTFDAIYWDLSKVKIGTNSFAGSILAAVGANKYSEFINDLNSGEMLLVIDAFDEAEIISGRKMISGFIKDISDSLTEYKQAAVVLLARTETAQYIASFCAENSIPISHYEIGFFTETAAKDFIIKNVAGEKEPTIPDIECTNLYYNVIKNNITQEESVSFLGYAPVLQAVAKHIKDCPNRQKMLSDLSSQSDCVSIIITIMRDLLKREREEKVVPAFIEKCKELHPEFDDWDKVYSDEEQLVRLIYYVLLEDTSYGNYSLDFLPPQLVDDYKVMLDLFLPQHPFIRICSKEENFTQSIDFTGPAFRDYVLAELILDKNYEKLVEMYFEESQSQSYFPSQIFFDCYMRISDKELSSRHISYVYNSYRAKATAYEFPFLQCSEISSDESDNNKLLAVFGMLSSPKSATKRDDYLAEIIMVDTALSFEQLINVSIDVPDYDIIVGRNGIDARIYNSSIICNKIHFETKNIIIESYEPEGCLLICRNGLESDMINIDISYNKELKVSAPNINSYYKLLQFKYDFDDISILDITKFIHALKCILIEFRTHRKDTLAKTADRIDHVTVGNSTIKRNVLNYLCGSGIIYKSGHLYKINESIMQEKGIYYNALARMDEAQLMPVFHEFNKWFNKDN